MHEKRKRGGISYPFKGKRASFSWSKKYGTSVNEERESELLGGRGGKLLPPWKVKSSEGGGKKEKKKKEKDPIYYSPRKEGRVTDRAPCFKLVTNLEKEERRERTSHLSHRKGRSGLLLQN